MVYKRLRRRAQPDVGDDTTYDDFGRSRRVASKFRFLQAVRSHEASDVSLAEEGSTNKLVLIRHSRGPETTLPAISCGEQPLNNNNILYYNNSRYERYVLLLKPSHLS